MGVEYKQRSLVIAGAVVTLAGIIDQLIHLSLVFNFSYWLSAAAIGLLAIVAASLMESKGAKIKIRMKSLQTQYRDWEY